MQLYCPTCDAAYTAVDRCPACAGRLVLPTEVREAVSGVAPPPPPDPIRPTALARATVGVVVAMGLYVGLREWAAAAAALAGGSLADGEDGALAVVVALRAAGVLAGGLVAGAGRPQGLATGALAGLVCGGLFLFGDVTAGATAGARDLGVVLGLAALAAAAGSLGGRVWPPAADLPDPLPDPRGSSLARLADEEKEAKRGRPTLWPQVLIGVSLIVAGVASADQARAALKAGTNGVLNVGGPAQAPVVDVELAALAVVAAGLIAGANTGAGLRHGLLVGAFGGLGVVLGAGRGGESFYLVTEGLHAVLGVPMAETPGRDALLLLFAAVFVGGSFGGWLGGQMFPPLVKRKRLRAID